MLELMPFESMEQVHEENVELVELGYMPFFKATHWGFSDSQKMYWDTIAKGIGGT